MANTYFITGIGTDVGKTIVAAIVTESLQADYWKPIQAGDLSYSDTHKVKDMVSNSISVFHQNSYALQTPESPHAAAKKDNIEIKTEEIVLPTTSNNIVVEGAGGLLVPLNESQTLIDIIKPSYKVILVSRTYLGSINHTLLSVEVLKSRGLKIAGIVFNGDENKETEEIIVKMTGIPVIGRIKNESFFDKKIIASYANQFRANLQSL